MYVCRSPVVFLVCSFVAEVGTPDFHLAQLPVSFNNKTGACEDDYPSPMVAQRILYGWLVSHGSKELFDIFKKKVPVNLSIESSIFLVFKDLEKSGGKRPLHDSPSGIPFPHPITFFLHFFLPPQVKPSAGDPIIVFLCVDEILQLRKGTCEIVSMDIENSLYSGLSRLVSVLQPRARRRKCRRLFAL